MITGRQIRAARGFLALDRRDFAQKSVVTIYTIERIEVDGEIPGAVMTKDLSAIKAALEAEGIEFTDGAGGQGVQPHSKKSKPKAKR